MSNQQDRQAKPPTADLAYTQRLQKLQNKRWKQIIDPQIPYAWNTRRICRGRVLEVGCGTGRNLKNLKGAAVGIDHNANSVAAAKEQGFEAYLPADFSESDVACKNSFDTLLVAHVLEHVTTNEGDELLQTYSKYLRSNGLIVLICPQERGFDSDDTHIRWVDVEIMCTHLKKLGAVIKSVESFPFPRSVGKFFIYNESVVIGQLSK